MKRPCSTTPTTWSSIFAIEGAATGASKVQSTMKFPLSV